MTWADARLRRRPTLCPILAALFLMVAPVAQADDYPEDYDPMIVDMCLENAEYPKDRETCIGRGAAACMTTEAGHSTLGIGTCFGAEWRQWDNRLNAVYQTLLVQQAQVAADNAAFNDHLPDAVEAMRTMQRNWIAYRDAACEWEYIQWGGGTGGGPASAECMMRLTAHQVLFLERHMF